LQGDRSKDMFGYALVVEDVVQWNCVTQAHTKHILNTSTWHITKLTSNCILSVV